MQHDTTRTKSLPKVLRIGHAGAGALAPPNTLLSIEVALRYGVDMVELDVRRCQDALVLHHDATLARTASIGRRVSDYKLDDLSKIDVGEGQHIPSLDEAVSLVRGRALLNVDLKEAGCEGAVLDVLRRHGALGDALISSSLPTSLRATKSLAPAVAVALSYPADALGIADKPYMAPVVHLALRLIRLTAPWRIRQLLAGSGADTAMFHHAIVSARLVEEAHSAGYRVFAWTVDELAAMGKLCAIGVDGIASNRPDLLAQLSPLCQH